MEYKDSCVYRYIMSEVARGEGKGFVKYRLVVAVYRSIRGKSAVDRYFASGEIYTCKVYYVKNYDIVTT